MWQVESTAEALAQRTALPAEATRALDAVVEQLRQDPWQGERYRGHPPEFRTWPFGAWGLAVYVILPPRRTVVLLDLLWAGE